MMLKEANELNDTAVLRILRRRGKDIKTDGIMYAVSRSQKPPIPKANATVLLVKNQKHKPSGPDPATSVAIPKVHFHGFQFTSVRTQEPMARPVVPHGDGVLNRNWDRYYRNYMGFSKFGRHLRTLPIIGIWFATN